MAPYFATAVIFLALIGNCRARVQDNPGGNVTEADFYKIVTVLPKETNFRAFRAASGQHTAPFGYRPGSATTSNSCQSVRAVPSTLRSSSQMKPSGLGQFYQKYTEAYGIPVLSSSYVPDDALRRACYTLRFLLAGHSGVRQSFYSLSGRVAVIGKSEDTTDIPEHSHLSEWWNQRARGLGATPTGPVSSASEENVLCYSVDRYPSQDIFLHESAHAVHLLGAAFAIPGWDTRLRNLYNEAKSIGLWANTYSMSTPEEYFAEGTQSYFNVNSYSAQPDGTRGPISTRDKLVNYDLKLYNMIKEVFPCDNTYLKRCESSRAQENAQHLQMDCDKTGTSTGGTTTGGTTTNNDCKDNHPTCPAWANNNECTNSPAYMNTNCQLSCKRCTTESTPCTDNHQNCQAWANNNECVNSQAYMHLNCKKSCNICTSAACIDDNQYCQPWSRSGECTNNLAYMKIHCKKSCNLC